MRFPRTGLAAAATLASAALLLSACSSSAPTTPPAGEDDAVSVVLVGGVAGDLSYTDQALSGLTLAADELGVETNHIEVPDVAQGEALLRSAIQTAPDLILVVTLDLETVATVAAEYPDQAFAMPDQSEEEGIVIPENLTLRQINTHEGSYLAGVVAASMSETGVIGAVVGGDSPGLNQFVWAYAQGALSVNPDITIIETYLNFQFNDPAVGKSSAIDQHSDGADVIFGIAGGTGAGVIEAATEGGYFVIGVDSNQDDVAPGTVITSMMKRVSGSVFSLIEDQIAGNITTGVTKIGLAEGATGLSWDEGSTTFADNGPEVATAKLADTEAAVETARAAILDGSLEVCDALNDADSDACAPFKD